MTFPFDTLRRWPDVEAPELLAADAADRLLLDESAGARTTLDDGALVVIGDTHGALTLASAAEGARRIRVHQDPLTGERALAANAKRLAVDDDAFSSLPFDADLVRDAEVVLLRLPRSLDELDDVAALIARHASPGVTVFAGGRIKHMTVAMNDVLRRHFDVVDVTHARQKSRVLVARGAKEGHDPEPRRATHDGLVVCAYGGVFAATSVDIGTRFLLDNISGRVAGGGTADDPVVDMACGTGVVAATFARQGLHAYASDQSAAAVASARATAEANGVSDLVRVERDDLLSMLDDASVSFIALNPPFHVGAAVYEGVAARLFADAARALRPGGELWTVWNSALLYRPTLERVVGPTRQIARNSKFTVMASVRSASAYDR